MGLSRVMECLIFSDMLHFEICMAVCMEYLMVLNKYVDAGIVW